jgi:hypothetical protein
MSNETIIAAREANRLAGIVRLYAKLIERSHLRGGLPPETVEGVAIRAMELAKNIVATHPRYRSTP